jgi:hypothetical protein
MLVLKDPQSGSKAGTTASHNRYGQYERNRRTPTQAPTARRTAIKALFAAASAGFSSLTAGQIASWASYADGHPITNALGSSVKLDAHAMYVRINSNRLNAGLTVTASPPETDAVDWTPGSVVVTLESETTFTVNLTGQPATTKFLISAGPVRSAGRNYEGQFTQLAVASTPFTVPTDVLAAYTTKYGAGPSDSVTFVKITPVSTEGVRGAPLVIRGVWS